MKLIDKIIAATLTLLLGLLVSTTRQPEAPTVSARQIRALQTNEQFADKFVIVDVRGEAETDVSVIPDAITKAQFEDTNALHQAKTILVYCTVGYRSGIYAKRLRAAGWNAFNYEGSILDWCEHQLPVVTPTGESTKLVHTYNASYALAQGYQAVY